MTRSMPALFFLLALVALVAGMIFGILASLQYIFPDFAKDALDFSRTRPLHVSCVVGWIVSGASGVVWYRLSSWGMLPRAATLHFGLFLLSGLLVTAFLASGLFGGREYMAFPPALSVPILLGWVAFAAGFFAFARRHAGKKWPAYLWMWGTGIGFFIFTFTEAHLWLIPWFRENLVRDITVQWKAYGALVGSWNMLVYGTALYIMHDIGGDDRTVRGRLPFALFFLGLFNLMFGWAHHTYIVPAQPWVRIVSYGVSMTELIILAKIIRDWRRSQRESLCDIGLMPCRLLRDTDRWILLNLVLAIAISVPAVNYYTHGTYITVAHAMGTTIGINSTILLAAIFHITPRMGGSLSAAALTTARRGLRLFGFSLLVFWLCLIFAGIRRSVWMHGDDGALFGEMQEGLRPFFIVFSVAGTGVFSGIVLMAAPLASALARILKLPGR